GAHILVATLVILVIVPLLLAVALDPLIHLLF
ncbi:MAG: hypothetical protein QOE92_2565, partial [Chloroflexota bacterium]|nr:hypothetical protein [Chloroflexota bacterium]